RNGRKGRRNKGIKTELQGQAYAALLSNAAAGPHLFGSGVSFTAREFGAKPVCHSIGFLTLGIFPNGIQIVLQHVSKTRAQFILWFVAQTGESRNVGVKSGNILGSWRPSNDLYRAL